MMSKVLVFIVTLVLLSVIGTVGREHGFKHLQHHAKQHLRTNSKALVTANQVKGWGVTLGVVNTKEGCISVAFPVYSPVSMEVALKAEFTEEVGVKECQPTHREINMELAVAVQVKVLFFYLSAGVRGRVHLASDDAPGHGDMLGAFGRSIIGAVMKQSSDAQMKSHLADQQKALATTVKDFGKTWGPESVKMTMMSLDMARVHVSKELSAWLRTEAYTKIFGWNDATNKSLRKTATTELLTFLKLTRFLKHLTHKLIELTLKHFYGFTGDFGTFDCSKAPSTKKIDRPKNDADKKFVDPVYRADMGTYSAVWSSDLALPSNLFCLLTESSVMSIFTTDDGNTNGMWSQYIPDRHPPADNPACESTNDLFAKSNVHSNPAKICTVADFGDKPKEMDCVVKIPMAAANVFQRAFSQISATYVLLIAKKTYPAQVQIDEVERLIREGFKDGDLSVYPAKVAGQVEFHRDWSYEAWRAIPAKQVIVRPKAANAIQRAAAAKKPSTFTEYTLADTAAVPEAKLGACPPVDHAPKNAKGFLMYGDEIPLLRPVGSGATVSSCGWVPFHNLDKLEMVMNNQITKIIERAEGELAASKFTMTETAGISIELKAGTGAMGNTLCSSDDATAALQIMAGIHWQREIKATAVSASRGAASNYIANFRIAGNPFVGVIPMRFMADFVYDKANGYTVQLSFLFPFPSGMIEAITVQDPIGKTSDSLGIGDKFTNTFGAKSNGALGLLAKGDGLAGKVGSAICSALKSLIPTAGNLNQLITDTAAAMHSKKGPAATPPPATAVTPEAKAALADMEKDNGSNGNKAKEGLKKVGTFLAKAGKEAYAGYTNGLLGLTKLDAAKKLASLAGFTAAFGGEVAVQFTIVKPNGKGWEIDGPNSGISIKLYTTTSMSVGAGPASILIKYDEGFVFGLTAANTVKAEVEAAPAGVKPAAADPVAECNKCFAGKPPQHYCKDGAPGYCVSSDLSLGRNACKNDATIIKEAKGCTTAAAGAA